MGARNAVTHKPSVARYDPTMPVLEKIFLIVELVLIVQLATKVAFGA